MEAAASKERMKQRTPREDWAELLRRTFDFDVFACVRCGGRRRPRREGHPSPHGVETQYSQEAQTPAMHLMGARPGQACTPRGLRRLSTDRFGVQTKAIQVPRIFVTLALTPLIARIPFVARLLQRLEAAARD